MKSAHHHPTHTNRSTSHQPLHIAYLPLEEIRPSKLSQKCWENVAESNDSLRRRWWYEVESGGEDNHVEYCTVFNRGSSAVRQPDVPLLISPNRKNDRPSLNNDFLYSAVMN